VKRVPPTLCRQNLVKVGCSCRVAVTGMFMELLLDLKLGWGNHLNNVKRVLPTLYRHNLVKVGCNCRVTMTRLVMELLLDLKLSWGNHLNIVKRVPPTLSRHNLVKVGCSCRATVTRMVMGVVIELLLDLKLTATRTVIELELTTSNNGGLVVTTSPLTELISPSDSRGLVTKEIETDGQTWQLIEQLPEENNKHKETWEL
jgi:hypothetical protein